MSEFGDAEPEDAWHPDDPVPVMIDNLLRRLDLLDHFSPGARYDALLDQVELRLLPWRLKLGSLPERDELRVLQTIEDLEHVRVRNDG